MINVKLEKKLDRRLPTAALGGSLAPETESSQSNSLVAACMDGVYRLNLQSGEHQKLYAHESYASSAHWLANGSILSGGYDISFVSDISAIAKRRD